MDASLLDDCRAAAGFKDRVLAVGREATLHKQLQELLRSHQVRAHSLRMLAVAASAPLTTQHGTAHARAGPDKAI
jgi:hypothetical protein